MISTGTLAGVAASKVRVQIPAWGRWWVDVDLVDPVELSGSQTLTLGDATAKGTVYGGVHEGRASYRVVGGSGGWGVSVGRKSYGPSDAGIRASTIINDAAREAGETVEDPPTDRIGAHYARREGAPIAVLDDLAPESWRVDLDGVTRFGLRPSTEYTGDAPRTLVDPGAGIVEIATESVASLLPGVVVDGGEPATDVEWILEEGRLTVRVYRGARLSRELDAFRDILDALDPKRRYRGTFEYRVISQTGNRLDLQVVRRATGLGDLSKVRMRPGIPGAKAQLFPGALVLVSFVDADPSRPVVVGFDDPDSPGWQPITLDIGGSGGLGVATQTSPVQAGPFGGTVTVGSTRVRSPLV